MIPNGYLMFEDENFIESSVAKLNALRKSGQFCDVRLQVPFFCPSMMTECSRVFVTVCNAMPLVDCEVWDFRIWFLKNTYLKKIKIRSTLRESTLTFFSADVNWRLCWFEKLIWTVTFTWVGLYITIIQTYFKKNSYQHVDILFVF